MEDSAKTCGLCEAAPAFGQGEHVLPRWYFKDRESVGPAPFTWSKNGEPIRDRDGNPIQRTERVRVFLDACEPCNSELNRRFEDPAKPILRRLFAARGEISLTASEAETVGLWMAKTLLLLAHPATRYADERIDPEALRWDEAECPPARFYRWLVNGDPPPEGLSVWLFRTDEHAEGTGEPEYLMPLPTVSCDGDVIDFVIFQQSFHGLHIAVVVHPGWPIEHPVEKDGHAIRLMPPTGAADLTALPVLPRHVVSWVRCRITLKDGALGAPDLAPLEPSPIGIPVVLNPHVLRSFF